MNAVRVTEIQRLRATRKGWDGEDAEPPGDGAVETLRTVKVDPSDMSPGAVVLFGSTPSQKGFALWFDMDGELETADIPRGIMRSEARKWWKELEDLILTVADAAQDEAYDLVVQKGKDLNIL